MSLHYFLKIIFVLFFTSFLEGCITGCSEPDSSGIYTCEEEKPTQTTTEGDEKGASFLSWLFEGEGEESKSSCTKKPSDVICSINSLVLTELNIEAKAKNGYSLKWLKLYKGPFENNILLKSLSLQKETFYLFLKQGPISVTALYASPTDTILTVDGININVEKSSYCRGTCYHSDPVYLDLRL